MEIIETTGKIYKLLCGDSKYYYGSTNSVYLSSRLASHRDDSKKDSFKNNKLHSYINSIGWDKVKIILIEELLPMTKTERRKKENEYIVKSLNDALCLNHNKSYRSREEQLEYQRIFNRNLIVHNKEEIICECGMKTNKGREIQHKKSLKHRSAMEKLDYYL